MCEMAAPEDITTPNCVSFHWHVANGLTTYYCDECEHGYYYRGEAKGQNNNLMYPPFCYPTFWMALQDTEAAYDRRNLQPRLYDYNELSMWKAV